MTTRPALHRGVAAALLALGWSACSRPASTPAPRAEIAMAVAVAPVTMADAADTFEAGGVVQARTTATIASRLLAPVLEVRATAGDRVRAGQLLVLLDGRDLAAHAHSASAAEAAAEQGLVAAASDQQAAEAALALARATHERVASLQAKRSATPQELDEATAALRGAEARAAGAAARLQAARSVIESARGAREAAATTASFSRLTAPFDGVITDAMVEAGNMAAPGAPLMRLEDTRGFRLEVRVDESRIGRVVGGAVVPVSLDPPTGGAPTTVSGTVTEVSRASDADAHAFLVKIVLPDPTGVRSGVFGRATFSAGPRRALMVPADAVTRRGQMASVFVVDNGIARVRLVNVNGTEVLAGLAEGDRVVLAPPPTLRDGQPVTEGGQR